MSRKSLKSPKQIEGDQSPTDQVGFIGLGALGKPMAKRLVQKGVDLIVHDVRTEPVVELQRLGAKVARSGREIGARSDIIVVMVRDTAQAEAVILAEDGVLSGAKPGSIILIMSTVGPHFCQRVARAAAEKKVGVLDVPVSGGAIAVEAGTLTMIVGGEKALLERCRNVLEIWGQKIFHVGDIGKGQVVKIANNLLSNINLATVYEGFLLATKAGVDLKRFIEIVEVSTGNSWAATHWHAWRKIKKEQVNGLEVTYKDLKLALDLAKASGIDLPLLDFVSNSWRWQDTLTDKF